jgi:hypothetical protein
MSMVVDAVNDATSRGGGIQKAASESTALVVASVRQVYLLRRLFERKLGMPEFRLGMLQSSRKMQVEQDFKTFLYYFNGLVGKEHL